MGALRDKEEGSASESAPGGGAAWRDSGSCSDCESREYISTLSLIWPHQLCQLLQMSYPVAQDPRLSLSDVTWPPTQPPPRNAHSNDCTQKPWEPSLRVSGYWWRWNLTNGKSNACTAWGRSCTLDFHLLRKRDSRIAWSAGMLMTFCKPLTCISQQE